MTKQKMMKQANVYIQQKGWLIVNARIYNVIQEGETKTKNTWNKYSYASGNMQKTLFRINLSKKKMLKPNMNIC